mgnify:CR=1 FL=1
MSRANALGSSGVPVRCVQVLGKRFTGLSGQKGFELTGALFDASDEDGSGDIDIQEFVLGLVKCMRGPLPTKIRMILGATAAVNGGSSGTTEDPQARRQWVVWVVWVVWWCGVAVCGLVPPIHLVQRLQGGWSWCFCIAMHYTVCPSLTLSKPLVCATPPCTHRVLWSPFWRW